MSNFCIRFALDHEFGDNLGLDGGTHMEADDSLVVSEELETARRVHVVHPT